MHIASKTAFVDKRTTKADDSIVKLWLDLTGNRSQSEGHRTPSSPVGRVDAARKADRACGDFSFSMYDFMCSGRSKFPDQSHRPCLYTNNMCGWMQGHDRSRYKSNVGVGVTNGSGGVVKSNVCLSVSICAARLRLRGERRASIEHVYMPACSFNALSWMNNPTWRTAQLPFSNAQCLVSVF